MLNEVNNPYAQKTIDDFRLVTREILYKIKVMSALYGREEL